MEIQFKCYHFNDKFMNTNWPNHVSVMINNQNVPIPVTSNMQNQPTHMPMFIKRYCNPGRNVIAINVRACCCSHLFTLQFVSRPSVRSILESISKQNLLKSEQSQAKIIRNFSANGGMAGGVNEDAIEQTAITVSLKCPITQQAIRLPARGRDCKHIQCFDLENFLIMNSRKASWSCPVCKKPAEIRNLEVDELIWGIINEKPKVDEVRITPNAQWSPIQTMDVKKEPDDNIGLPIKRCRTDDYQIRPQNPPDQRIMPNSQIGPAAPGGVPGGIQAMQQHQVRMAAAQQQINPRMPMNHPAMMNSHPQMHPAMMNAMGTPNMTIPPNHHVSANPNLVTNHPAAMSHPAMGPVVTSMGPIGPGHPGPIGHGNITPGHPHMVSNINAHPSQMSPSVQTLQQQQSMGSPGMPMTPGMPHTPNIPGMPPTPVMTPNNSTSSNMPPNLPHSQGLPSNGGMPPTPGMPHTPGMHPVPNIVPSPQMVGAPTSHHPVSTVSYPTSVMLSSNAPGPLKPQTPHGPMLKPPTPIMNPRTPKTPQSMGQVTTAHLTSPHPAPSPVRPDLPQIAPSPQATLNGNFNSPHAIIRSPNTTSVGYDPTLLPHTTANDTIPYNSMASPFSPHSNLAQTLTPLTEPTTLVSSGTATTMSFPTLPSDDITQSALDANLDDDDSEIWNLFDSQDSGLFM